MFFSMDSIQNLMTIFHNFLWEPMCSAIVDTWKADNTVLLDFFFVALVIICGNLYLQAYS